MRGFARFCILVFCILVVSLSVYSQKNITNSGDKLWSFHCGALGNNCVEMYPKFFERLEDELAGSSAFFESRGFKNGVFLLVEGGGTASKTQIGPHLAIKKFSNTNKGDERCSAEGELASYVLSGGMSRTLELRNFQVYNMFDNEDGKTKLLEPCPFDPDNLQELIMSLSHEVFHGYQYSAADLKNPPGKKSTSIAWIDEATAEAAGYSYTKKIMGKATFADGEYYYDLPLHDDDPGMADKGYRRGHFMYEVGKMINSSTPISWMSKIYDNKPQTTRFGYDWLDSAFKDAGQKNLSEAYIKFIAKKANERRFYKETPVNLAVSKRDENPQIDTLVSEIMAAEPFYADYKGSVFNPVPEMTYPGEYAALLEIKIKPENSNDSSVLVVEEDIAKKDDRKKYIRLAALDGKAKKLFSRAINAPTKENSLQAVKNKVEVSAKTVQFSISNCMPFGKTTQISFEPELPEDVDVKMSAKHGTIDAEFNYTSPNREVIDELKVELLIGEEKTEKLIFAKPRISRNGCQYRLLTADGYTITFDPGTETTKTEGRDKSESAVFDREFIYVRDPSMGWLKMRPSQMQQMLRMAAKSTIGFPSISEKFADIFVQGMNDMQTDPLKWGKAPYDFLDWLERSKLNKFTKGRNARIKVGKVKETCPTSGGKCTVYSIEGKSKVYYDTKNRIDAIQTSEGIHKVEYGAYVFEVPKNAQVIQF